MNGFDNRISRFQNRSHCFITIEYHGEFCKCKTPGDYLGPPFDSQIIRYAKYTYLAKGEVKFYQGE